MGEGGNTSGVACCSHTHLRSAAAQELRNRLQDVNARLSDAEAKQLADAQAAEALRERLKNADTELTAMTLNLEEQRKKAEETLTLLAAAERANTTMRTSAADQLSERERQKALLNKSMELLSAERTRSAEAVRRVTLLNQQAAELRKQLDQLQGLLDLANEKDVASRVQIDALGKNLNTALAQVADEQKKRADNQQRIAELEAAERARLEEEAKDLRKFRSEFFSRVSRILGQRQGVKVQGDRFVFSSEVLFGPGSADLGPAGAQQISRVARVLRDVADEIPPEINWVLRVDGHTDNVPLSGFGEFRNNWELSQARALSVVLYLIEQEGIPAGRLAATGFGEYQPVDSGSSDAALARNRRIELKFTEK